MTSSNSIGKGKSFVDLSNGVGISLRVSGPLAQMMSIIVGADSVKSIVSIASVVGWVLSVGNISGVVSMTSSNGIGKGKSFVDLSNGVGISLRVSRPLTQMMRIDAVKACISSARVLSVGDVSRIVSMASSNGIGEGKSFVDLGDGVGISIGTSVPRHGSNSNTSKYKGLHCFTGQSS